jgi:hypothetical protein
LSPFVPGLEAASAVPMRGTLPRGARFSCMSDTSTIPLEKVLENSFRIAWDYLEATGEISEPEPTAYFLLDAIEKLMSRGELRPLLLSNKAIEAYQRAQASKNLALVS